MGNKNCVVCTMPLQKEQDFPGGDTSLTYCIHCGNTEGLHPYKKLIEGMSKFLQEVQGMAEEEASRIAKQMIDHSEAVSSGLLEIDS